MAESFDNQKHTNLRAAQWSQSQVKPQPKPQNQLADQESYPGGGEDLSEYSGCAYHNPDHERPFSANQIRDPAAKETAAKLAHSTDSVKCRLPTGREDRFALKDITSGYMSLVTST